MFPMTSSPQQNISSKTTSKQQRPQRDKGPLMATTRRDSSSTSTASDHRPRDRRGLSPTITPKPTSRPSSAAASPEKARIKPTPNYLRPTVSSRHDPPPTVAKPTKKQTTSTTPAAPVRARSTPVQQPRVQLSKEKSIAKSTPSSSRTVVAGGVTRPMRASGNKAKAPLSNPKKSDPPPVASVLEHEPVDFPETVSEPEIVIPTVKLTSEDEVIVDELGHGESDAATSPEVEKQEEHVEPCRIIEEKAPQECKKEAEERKDTIPTKQKASTQVNKSVGVVDEELQKKLRARQAWEVVKDAGGSVVDGTKAVADMSKTATAAKKESTKNGVIEEAASKLLMEKRKNKVLALVGAFETVMSLQEPESKGETPKAADVGGSTISAFDKEMREVEEENGGEINGEVDDAEAIVAAHDVDDGITDDDNDGITDDDGGVTDDDDVNKGEKGTNEGE